MSRRRCSRRRAPSRPDAISPREPRRLSLDRAARRTPAAIALDGACAPSSAAARAIGGASSTSAWRPPSRCRSAFEDVGIRAADPACLGGQHAAHGTGDDYLTLDVIVDGTAGTDAHRRGPPAAAWQGRHGRADQRRAASSSAGVGDRPPRIDDPEIAARLVTWLRLRPVPRTLDSPPPVPGPASMRSRSSSAARSAARRSGRARGASGLGDVARARRRSSRRRW